jgi:hypothetical protein
VLFGNLLALGGARFHGVTELDVTVGVTVFVGVRVLVGVTVGVNVLVGVSVLVGVTVGVMVFVGVGLGLTANSINILE